MHELPLAQCTDIPHLAADRHLRAAAFVLEREANALRMTSQRKP
jgi:hypothetical protein